MNRRTVSALSAAEQQAYVDRICSAAPRLTERQRSRLAGLVRGSLAAALIVLAVAGCGPDTAPAAPTTTTRETTSPFPAFLVPAITGLADPPGSYAPGTDPLLAPLQRG